MYSQMLCVCVCVLVEECGIVGLNCLVCEEAAEVSTEITLSHMTKRSRLEERMNTFNLINLRVSEGQRWLITVPNVP